MQNRKNWSVGHEIITVVLMPRGNSYFVDGWGQDITVLQLSHYKLLKRSTVVEFEQREKTEKREKREICYNGEEGSEYIAKNETKSTTTKTAVVVLQKHQSCGAPE